MPQWNCFFGRYKTSSVRDHVFADEAEVRANVFEYVEVFYNRFRKHSALAYQSPPQAEAKFLPPWGARHIPITHPATKPLPNKTRDSRVSHTQATLAAHFLQEECPAEVGETTARFVAEMLARKVAQLLTLVETGAACGLPPKIALKLRSNVMAEEAR